MEAKEVLVVKVAALGSFYFLAFAWAIVCSTAQALAFAFNSTA